MSCFRKSFKSAKCKALLKLVLIRIKIVRKKHEIQLKHMRLDVSRLLQIGQDENAEIRVAHVIREQNIIDGFNMIESFCERVIKQMSVIRAQKSCPTDLQEAVSSLLFAGPRCAKLPELLKVREVFSAKYGKDFVTAAIEPNKNSAVSKQIIEKLSFSTPMMATKVKLMQDIALEYGIKWNPVTLGSKLCQQFGDSEGSNRSMADANIGSRAKPVFPISESSSSQSTSKKQEDNSILMPPSLSSDDEDDVDFDARNQFIVSVMPIRTMVLPQSENNFQDTMLPVRLNAHDHHTVLTEKMSLQEKVQSTAEQLSANFALQIKDNTINTEYQIPYRDVITAAESAAKSADHAAAAAKTAAMLAMNAFSQKASITRVATEKAKDVVICEESTDSLSNSHNTRFSHQESVTEMSRSSREIPVRSRLPHPVGISVRTRSDLQQQAVVQATDLLQLNPAMPANWVLDDPIADAASNFKRANSKKKVNAHSKVANEYSSAWNTDDNTILSHEDMNERIAPQHSQSISRVPPSGPGYTYHRAQSDNFFSSSGPSHRKETCGVNTIPSRDQKLNLQSSRVSRVIVRENSAGTVGSGPVSVHSNSTGQSRPEQKNSQEIGMGGKEQGRRQENTKIHPVTNVPGIISSAGSKRSTSNSFIRIMHSCLSA
ncbi:hypothetical protein O6H91_01G159300 [Diphasiastrum complanatum]|uniref:Uncharacterized protein n=5 Tax=Diphasiastrum complanatum TaxID=34168 RepID=A0ACC2EXW9_DIPCM|nr:hypothetical protein O6H91_01G159300 [Diphasiastrum complanatum]KAJ7571321.1 hypothetical protein O6H91_01G159300 [Diphasiastrum complanatum]KAJ7571322.1 hypothetical protein O6H91_01G159300 [Diphasiastrum complanatum]KAJ7571323.1 hypothetical protein O6H91_01G159300 [Diphasiastrum complanatum]KAJ7571324.1 hypothetical protein O6H91_01G159300 [Diphasiastrum complanatum]